MSPAPRWDVPTRYGYAAAVEGMGSVAAPLLAGFSVALVALVIQGSNHFRFPNVALIVFAAAALAFIACVQFTFHARSFVVTPPELEMWWSNPDDPQTRDQLRWEQRFYREQHDVWARRASHMYSVGVLALLLGLVVMVLPVGPLGDAPVGRLLVVGLAVLGFSAEFAWVAHGYICTPRDDWGPPPPPEREV
jgi:hypothetical protein